MICIIIFKVYTLTPIGVNVKTSKPKASNVPDSSVVQVEFNWNGNVKSTLAVYPSKFCSANATSSPTIGLKAPKSAVPLIHFPSLLLVKGYFTFILKVSPLIILTFLFPCFSHLFPLEIR